MSDEQLGIWRAVGLVVTASPSPTAAGAADDPRGAEDFDERGRRGIARLL